MLQTTWKACGNGKPISVPTPISRRAVAVHAGLFVYVSQQDDLLVVFDTTTGRETAKWPLDNNNVSHYANTGGFYLLAFDAVSHTAFIATDGVTLAAKNVITGVTAWQYNAPYLQPRCVTLSTCYKYVAALCSSTAGAVRTFDAVTGTPRSQYPLHYPRAPFQYLHLVWWPQDVTPCLIWELWGKTESTVTLTRCNSLTCDETTICDNRTQINVDEEVKLWRVYDCLVHKYVTAYETTAVLDNAYSTTDCVVYKYCTNSYIVYRSLCTRLTWVEAVCCFRGRVC